MLAYIFQLNLMRKMRGKYLPSLQSLSPIGSVGSIDVFDRNALLQQLPSELVKTVTGLNVAFEI